MIPPHAHPHEQVTSVVRGEMVMTVGGETRTMRPRSVVTIPANAEHSVNALTDCYVIDAFYPVRDDYR